MNKAEQGKTISASRYFFGADKKNNLCIFNTLCPGEFIFALRHLRMSVHLATKLWPFQLKTEENCSVIEANHVSCLVMVFNRKHR